MPDPAVGLAIGGTRRQVKARMSHSKRVQSEGFVTFVPRAGLDLLFVAVDLTRHGDEGLAHAQPGLRQDADQAQQPGLVSLRGLDERRDQRPRATLTAGSGAAPRAGMQRLDALDGANVAASSRPDAQ